MIYTQSRAALIALLIVAIAIGVLHGVRLRVLAVAVVRRDRARVARAPQSLQQRVDALSDGSERERQHAATTTRCAGARARTSPACEMWADHPLLGVGPDNFEVHYQTYSGAIGIDPRAEPRGAHNLYLESLAETGVLGDDRLLRRALAGAERRVAGALAASTGATPCSARGCRGARRLPHLRPHPAQRLRALRVDLPGPRAWRRAASRGGRPDDRGRGGFASAALVAWVYAGYPFALALLGRLRPRPAAPGSARAARCRSSSPPTTRSR